MPPALSIVQAITLAVAVLGAVLGVINTWHGLNKSRVRLLVRPKHAIPVGGFNPAVTFCVEVINMSAFALTIEDVGVLYRGSRSRGCIINPVFADGGQWPRRLEPRSSVTVYSRKPEVPPGARIKCAYATPQCGVTKTGITPALRQIAREA